MKREIKFKFYDKKRKRLMDVISIGWEKGILVCSYGGQAWISLIEHGDLVQYSDHRDKHGKEIYEGDVLFENDPFGGKKLEVFWDEKLSGFHCRRSLYHCPIPESKNIEVIGNGYEYPELLESN
jgi:hypothetical protein